ncbi:MAG: phosphate/phosphite/phosphonate ABC transporter substrate-binding protein, partial [Zoogloea sp.]|nr:phosphate/phosphite/phosphonate ABC transporter substrate-binding protein [Zoogloea sp.]
LRGKLIALSSRLSISSVGGLRWLEQHGLKVGRDIGVIEKPTPGAAIAAVAGGEADAALTTYTPLRQAPDDVRQRVRTLETDIAIPHLITMAHRRLGKPMVANIRKALLNFEASAEGKAFFTQTGYLGYDVLTSEDIDTLRPYVELVRKLIREGR